MVLTWIHHGDHKDHEVNHGEKQKLVDFRRNQDEGDLKMVC